MKINDKKLANGLVSGAVLLGLLVYGRLLLVPLVFALLLWAVVNALVDLLRRWRFPAWLAWLTAFALIGVALYVLVLVLVNESAALFAQVPRYAAKAQRMLTVRLPFVHRPLDFEQLLKQSGLPGEMAGVATSIGGAFFEAGLIAIYVGFLLAEQRYLFAKLARLRRIRGSEHESETVIRAIGHQIRTYLGVSTLMSAAMAAVTYALLSALGVQFAGFWALMMFFLTYIPTVGALAVVLPALVAFLQFQSVGYVIAIILALGIAHFVLTDIIEPVMLGRSLSLSPFAIILALTFWWLVWGIAGLFLAVPMTGVFAIACRHIEGFGWVDEMIGRSPRPHHSWLRWPAR